MAYVRAAVQIVVDAAHCDGMLTVQGVGRDWRTLEPRDALDIGQRTPDLGGQYGWHYNGLFERIPALNGIAPIMTYTPADMDLGDWTVQSGMWRESHTSGNMRHKALEFYDGLPGRYGASAHGHLTSTADWAPNVDFIAVRMPQAPDETEPGTLELWFRGATAGDLYCIGWPTAGPSGAYGTAQGRTGWQSHPYLMGKRTGDSTWTLIDTLRSTTVPGEHGKTLLVQHHRIQYLDGTLLISTDGKGDPWAFSGTWMHSSGDVTFALDESAPIDLVIVGHTALIGVYQLAAPASAVLYPSAFLVRRTDPPAESNTPNYRVVGTAPAGTSITAAVDTHGTNSDAKRPALTFVSAGGKRPVLYGVQEYRTATVGSADSDPVTLTSGDATFRTLSVRGHVDRRYQGATCEIEYTAIPGEVLNEMRPNAKVVVGIGGQPVGGGAASYTTHFTGYALPPTKTKERARSHGSVICEDMATARLAKKQLGWFCSLGGWPVDDAFEYILNRAGVPSALISVDAGVSYAGMGALYYLPQGTRKGTQKLMFAPDKSVPSALDEICTLRNLRWGVTTGGVVFLAPAVAHVAGHYDVALGETDATNVAFRFRHERSAREFRNLVQVMVGEGVEAAAGVLVDAYSWSDPTSTRFVGDLWTRYIAASQADDLSSVIARAWDDLTYNDSVIQWTELDRPGIWPNAEVAVTVGNDMNIVAGSIYRVTSKAYTVGADGRYRQTLDAELVEVAA
jgi:hypothetical protein